MTELTWEDLKNYVGSTKAADESFVNQCYQEALSLIGAFVGNSVIPQPILDRAALEVGSELYHRRNAPNGLAQYEGFDGTPVRIARDPMVAAYPILARFMVIGL